MRGALLAVATLLRAHVMCCPAGCECFNTTWMQYSCITQGGRLEAELEDGKLRVACLDLNALKPLQRIPALATRTAFIVRLERCLPPRAGWGAALNALGATHTRKLLLQAPDQPPLQFWKPEHFKDLVGLEQLYLLKGGHVPSDLLFKFHKLKLLGLWIVSLPSTLALPPALEELELRQCDLDEVSERTFATAPGLVQLTVHGNETPMRVAPGTLAGLTKLHAVEVKDTLLSSLPPRWLALPALEVVELKSCSLRELPADLLAGSRFLQNLSFAHNKLEALPPKLLEGLSELRWLDLQDNKLKALPPTFLVPARHLKYLKLSENNLGQLEQTIFSTDSNQPNQVQELEHLDLSFNSFNAFTLQQWNFLIFGNMTLELDLRHNAIKTIIFPSESARPSACVLLAANPIDCNCSLYNVLRHAMPYGSLNITGSFCLSPQELHLQPLSKVSREQLTCPLAMPACPPTCTCSLRPGLATGLLILVCLKPPPVPAWPDPANYQLRASALRLTTPLASLVLALPQHCRNLSLAALNLTHLPPTLLPPLDLLDLSDNLLQELPEWLPVNGTHLLLRGNPLRCDCVVADALARLQRATNHVDDWEALRCPDGAILSRISIEQCPVKPWRALVGLGALGVGLGLVAMALTLRYAHELRGWAATHGLGCCWPADPADANAVDRGKCYDVFISYAHGDERWVLNELVPRLERARLRLCLHFRDWEAGGWIPAQIERSVRQARRTLLVVSPHYLASYWARQEWRAALAQTRPRLVLLLLGQLPSGGAGLPAELREHMARHTYVKVDDPWFWSKLRLALPRWPMGPASLREQRPDIACRLAFDDRLNAVSTSPAPLELALETITAETTDVIT